MTDRQPRPPRKILLIGNHTCGNRGDSAILRGLIAHIEGLFPRAEVIVTSRYPVSSSFLLSRPVISDPIAGWADNWRPRLPVRIRRAIKDRVPSFMAYLVRSKTTWLRSLLPARLREIIFELERYDTVIQVGGSFFVDLYGERQFELPFAAVLARRPLYLLGHSMGPFGGTRYRRLAATLLASAEGVALREPVSFELVKAAGLTGKIRTGADTAWLVPVEQTTEPRLDVRTLTKGRPAIAITLRDLAPFDKRLGVTQAQFEQAFASLADKLLSLGYDILACATCTGIDSYHRDDRMPALRVREQVHDASRFHVVMDELNDVELGQLLGSCDLLVGTRLHSAIIAMNFGTPAIALNYEHKSAGIFRQLGLSELSCPISELLDGSLANRLPGILDQLEIIESRVKDAVAVERQRAADMVDSAFECLATRE